MDSLTQIVLGAAVGEVLLGRKLGNKAMLLGAIGGTIPDLDVVYNFFSDDPIANLRVHRAYSHSMFTHLVLSVPLAWVSRKWSKSDISFSRWYLFWFLALFTHALLDCCTTYGTQFLLPFTNYQVAFNNISVIDPLYTLPFLILLVIALFYKRTSTIRKKWVNAALIYSSAYMLLTFGLKFSVQQKFSESLASNGIQVEELNTTPTILNAILWSATAYNDSMLYVAEYSFLKPDEPIQWIPFTRHRELMKTFDCEGMQTLNWFSDGNYFLQPHGTDSVSFYNVKWGRGRFDTTVPEEAFIFYFTFYKENGVVKYHEKRPRDWKISEAFSMLATRIGI
jgi:inner membrane protein